MIEVVSHNERSNQCTSQFQSKLSKLKDEMNSIFKGRQDYGNLRSSLGLNSSLEMSMLSEIQVPSQRSSTIAYKFNQRTRVPQQQQMVNRSIINDSLMSKASGKFSQTIPIPILNLRHLDHETTTSYQNQNLSSFLNQSMELSSQKENSSNLDINGAVHLSSMALCT